MNSIDYKKIVEKNTPKINKSRNIIISFMVGGLIGLLGQFLTDFYSYSFNISTKEASTIMILTYIFISVLFTSLGFFDSLVTFCKAGLIIPITGFAHSVASCGIEFKKEGIINGLGSNVFKLAGSVLFYGISISFIVGLIRYLIGVI